MWESLVHRRAQQLMKSATDQKRGRRERSGEGKEGNGSITNRIDDRMRPQETKRQVKEFGVRYANALAL